MSRTHFICHNEANYTTTAENQSSESKGRTRAGARKGEPGFSQVAARLVNEPTAAQGRRRFGDVEVEPRAFSMEARFIRRNFTERARRLISRNAGIAARVFAQTASAP